MEHHHHNNINDYKHYHDHDINVHDVDGRHIDNVYFAEFAALYGPAHHDDNDDDH